MERANSTDSIDSPARVIKPARRRASSKLTEWQSFFLSRLEALVERQRESPEQDPALQVLLSKAIYSTYLDCQTEGVGDAASQVLAAGSQTSPSAN